MDLWIFVKFSSLAFHIALFRLPFGSMKTSILLVDDAPEVKLLVETSLHGLSCALSTAETAQDGIKYLTDQKPDLILLDIHLPDQSGLELYLEIQKNPILKQIPVIFLTGKKDVTNKVTAFSLGAEDYIEKTFHPLEFRARVEAKLKKQQTLNQQRVQYSIGNFIFDLSSQKVTMKDSEKNTNQDVDLSPKEFKLFYLLAKHPDQIFSRAQILDTVWGHNIHVYDRTVDTHVCSLRKKLGNQGERIKSVPGEGYRFQ